MEIQNIVQIMNRAIKMNKHNKNRVIKTIMQLLQNNKN